MINRMTFFLLGTAVLAAILAGCGGGGDAEGSGGTTIVTSPLSKTQYTKRVDAICAKGAAQRLEKINRYLSQHGSSSKSEGELSANALRTTVLPEVRRQIEEIEDLGAPSGDEEEIEDFLAAQRASVSSLASRRSLSLATDLNPAFSRAGELARAYGIEACAYN